MNTTLILSAVTVMFFFIREPFDPAWPLVIFGGIALVYRRARYSLIYWLGIMAIMATYLAMDWFQFSRSYLIFYWIIAIMLAMSKKSDEGRQQVLAINAQYLLAFTMLIAACCKCLSPDYLNGRFFMSWLLLSPSTVDFANAILGQSHDVFMTNQATLGSVIKGGSPGTVDLAITKSVQSRLHAVAIILAWWGMVIEFAIGVLFLFPCGRMLSSFRHALFIVFCLTCYAVLPVFTFAAILIVLGLAQTRADQVWIRRGYFALIPLVALFTAMPMFYGWSRAGLFVTNLLAFLK